MSRIPVIDFDNANADQKVLLEAIASQMEDVPKHIKVLANSPTALKAFMGMLLIANQGSLSRQTCARIAIAIAQRHSCEYDSKNLAASGHKVGLTGNEIDANREGTSEDARAAVAVRLALSLSETIGAVESAQLTHARVSGFTNADIVEIIAHVGMNLLAIMLANASHTGASPTSQPNDAN
ncbi:MAG: carboxymuconolactone decarboxylase family protein [Burkholderiaceae bacterium]